MNHVKPNDLRINVALIYVDCQYRWTTLARKAWHAKAHRGTWVTMNELISHCDGAKQRGRQLVASKEGSATKPVEVNIKEVAGSEFPA